MRWRRLFQGIAVAAVAMLFASACLSEEGGGGGGGGGEAEAGDKQIEIMYGFGGDQSKGFEQGMAEFIQSSGINIKFTDASQSFDTLIRPRVQGNNPPDIALFPQPGLMLDFARQGKLQDLGGMLNMDSLRASLVPGILDTGTLEGKTYGVPMSMNVKSLVWYPKKAFEAKGYKTPTTIAELEALTNQIKADGTTPWCVGLESAAATGWVGTDATAAPRSTTSGSGTRSPSTIRWWCRPARSSRSWRWPTATSSAAARGSWPPTSPPR
jgi:alpha-glucoside transport system substrate-binding protein